MLWALLGFYLAAHGPLLAHEMGHIWAAKRYGLDFQGVRTGIGPALFRAGRYELRLLPSSAQVLIPDLLRAPAAQQRMIALAGPFTSLALGLALFPISPPFAQASVLLGVLNLLPLRGLDGWFVLRRLPIKTFYTK